MRLAEKLDWKGLILISNSSMIYIDSITKNLKNLAGSNNSLV
jgi:hypothetical protein